MLGSRLVRTGTAILSSPDQLPVRSSRRERATTPTDRNRINPLRISQVTPSNDEKLDRILSLENKIISQNEVSHATSSNGSLFLLPSARIKAQLKP